MMTKLRWWGEKYGLLSLIVLVGFILRVIGIQFGKPFRYHPDELKLVYQAGNLLQIHNWSRDLIFLIGVYPPFFTYVLAIAFGIYSVLLLIFGIAPDMAAVKALYYIEPFNYHLIGRWISALSGTATLFILYRIGEKLYSRATGLMAAGFLAVSFLHVRNSHFGVVDVFLTMLVMLSFYFSVGIFRQGRTRDYVLAGVFAGLATATKWNAAIIVLPIVAAHFLSPVGGRTLVRKLFERRIYLAGVACLGAFLVACPMPLVDFREFWGGIVGTAEFQQSGTRKLGAGGSFWSYFTGDHSPGYGFFYDNSFVLGLGLFATIAFSLGVLYLLWRHRREDVLVLIFPIVMYALIGQMNYKAMRHLLPMVPFLHLIASEFVRNAKNVAQHQSIQRVVLVAAAALIMVPTGLKALRYDMALCQVDTRTRMKDWIEANIPADTKIGVEEFHPPLLSKHDLNLEAIWRSGHYKAVYDVYGLVPGMFAHGRQRTEDHNPVRYITDNEIEYLVLDSFTYDRYHWKFSKLKHPDIVAARDAFYRWVDENCERLHTEPQPNQFNICPELKIYRVRK